MRAVWVVSWALPCAVVLGAGCREEEPEFELNARRVAELANATCSCSDSVATRDCAASYERVLSATLVEQVAAGRAKINGALWGDCIAELHACSAVPDACADLIEGTRLKGEACDANSEECAPGLRCEPDDPEAESCGLAGTCRAIERFERGERCELAGACARGTICGVATSGDDEGEQVCREPLEEGEACPIADHGLAGTALCELGLGCVPDGDEVVCGEPLGEGEACTFAVGEELGRAACVSGAFCNPASGVCERFPFPDGAELGEPCEVRADCLPGLVCVDDECAYPLPNGSACEGEGQCAAQCSEGRCAPSFTACGLE